MAQEQSLQLELGDHHSSSDGDVAADEVHASYSIRAKALVAALGLVAILAGGAAMERQADLHASLANRVKDFAGLTALNEDNLVPGTVCPNGCCPHTNWYCCPDAISCAVDAPSCTVAGDKSSNLIAFKNTQDQCMYDPTPANAPSCFPGDANVQIFGSLVPVAVADLNEGDEVLVSSNTYEPVMGFLHTLRGSFSNLEITHERGVFRASSNHLVFTTESDKRIADVEVGDMLIVDGGPSRVLSTAEKISTAGMYAPLTSSGRVVVDGVLASAYAGMATGPKTPHTVMHTLFFPARAYHALGLSKIFSAGYVNNGRGEQMSALVSLYFQILQLHKLQSMLT
eukprot:TRINITY_DN4377_c0_g1_i1.p1 TRINITY_DN4377_c0_g1~~TRINITY_DN4377_c0_g1_i1.p1  ORF type:complete len:341 (+),score=50.88 TRINITY_DN4377_c0_g1_i1:70-1092(+)